MSGGSSAPAVSAAVREQAEGVCSTLQSALAALKDGSDASCPAPSRQQVAAAVQLVRMEVAKMGLLYSGQGSSGAPSASPSDAEAGALLAGFQEAACTLCMVLTGLATGTGSGPTLRASLHQTATAAVEACVSLVRGAVLGGAQEAQLMVLSGFALDMLAAAEKAPLDSRTAIGRAVTLVLKQLTDAKKELDEAIELSAEAAAGADEDGAGGGGGEASGAANGAPDAAASDGDSDAGFGFEAEAFNAQQLGVARRAATLLAAVVGLVRTLVRQLLAEREGLSADAVEGWESMLFHVKGLAPVADDLAAATYPPQDEGELASAAEALATACDLLQDECPPPSEQPAEGQGGDSGTAALAAAAEAVRTAASALSAELPAADGDAAGADAAAA